MPPRQPKELAIATRPRGSWLQTERAAHEKWARLTVEHPKAGALLHCIVAQMGRNNALIISLPNLAKLARMSRSSVIRAIVVLREQRWIQVLQIGPTGTTNAYVVNSEVAWQGAREGIRHALFTAAVFVSEDEQPQRAVIEGQPSPLHRIPAVHPGEQQLPTGDGLPPPSEPSLPGLEPDLPTLRK